MRIVVKIGTQSLMTAAGTLDRSMVRRLVAQIATLKKKKHEVILVSSGAVGTGRGMLAAQGKKLKFADPVLQKQALASLGQAELIHVYNGVLKKYGLIAAQLLMTQYDFRQRRHYVNIARLIDALLQDKNILPVLNENDSLAVEELMFTDNDALAGLVAAALNADRLVMLTTVDGVLDPETGALIEEIDINKNWPTIGAGTSTGGRGGMRGKVDTARKMAEAGITCHIASAKAPDVLVRLAAGARLGTTILPVKKSSGVKRWLTVKAQEARGCVVVNAPLAARLAGAGVISILPVGIVGVAQAFDKGDIVRIVDEAGAEIGLGQARYGADTLTGYVGQNRKPVFIHYDALKLKRNG